MAGAWIAHVKATWKKNGGSYKDAMKAAKKTWKKGGSSSKSKSKDEEPAAPKRRRRRKKKIRGSPKKNCPCS